jgi:antitoxin CptB
MDLEVVRKRLIFRSWHRGCKETDVILGNFCDANIHQMNAEEIAYFEAILEEEDADLYRWLTGELPMPEHMQKNPLMQRLIAFDVQAAMVARLA